MEGHELNKFPVNYFMCGWLLLLGLLGNTLHYVGSLHLLLADESEVGDGGMKLDGESVSHSTTSDAP